MLKTAMKICGKKTKHNSESNYSETARSDFGYWSDIKMLKGWKSAANQMQNLVSYPLSNLHQNLIKEKIWEGGCLIGVGLRLCEILLYSGKTLKILFRIYTDRDCKVKQRILQSATKQITKCDRYYKVPGNY